MKKDKMITAFDLINFKKVSIVLTGKDFNLRADRGFGRHAGQVNGLIKCIDQWLDGLNVKSEVPVLKEMKVLEISKKKSTAKQYDSLKADREFSVGLRYTDELGHWQSCESDVVKFEKLQSLPWTTLVYSYASKGAIRKGENGDFYTKRTHEGKLEILKHESKDSAFIYAEQNFK